MDSSTEGDLCFVGAGGGTFGLDLAEPDVFGELFG